MWVTAWECGSQVTNYPGPLIPLSGGNSNLNCQIRTVFLYDSLIIIWGEMGYFKVLGDKGIIKADSRLFLTLIFSTIP